MYEQAPLFGKQLLRTLSTGMYLQSFFLYREYIQNAADAIDEAVRDGILDKEEARIEVIIKEKKRSILIKDTGTGICASQVAANLINIGMSQKDPKNQKGRFGIGRMGGLGYCKTLRFETSASGEGVKSIIEWDAQELQRLIDDKDCKDDAGTIIQKITKIRQERCQPREHFFNVTLEGVTDSHDELLDESLVREYLEQVAPIPFDIEKFPWCQDIYDFLEDNEIEINEYCIDVNGDEIYKRYSDPIQNPSSTGVAEVEILGICADLIKNDEDENIGWYWIAGTNFSEAFNKKCTEKGLRLRQWNIQIGEHDCLSRKPLWTEERGNNYFVGEVHALDPHLVPNGRRDYFDENQSCRDFEDILRKIFANLYTVYRSGSKISAAQKAVKKAAEVRKKYEEKEKHNSFYNRTQQVNEQSKVEEETEKANAKLREVKRLKEKHNISTSKKDDPSITQSSNDGIEVARNLMTMVFRANPTPSTASSAKTKKVLEKKAPGSRDSSFVINNLSPRERKILEIVKDELNKNVSEKQADEIFSAITRRIIKL